MYDMSLTLILFLPQCFWSPVADNSKSIYILIHPWYSFLRCIKHSSEAMESRISPMRKGRLLPHFTDETLRHQSKKGPCGEQLCTGVNCVPPEGVLKA